MLLIQNGLLYTMEDERPFYGDILLEEGKIFQIAEHIQIKGCEEVIDAKGKLVLPGFIDAHSHLGIAEEIAAEGFPAIAGPSLSSRSKYEVRELDFKTPGILQKAGVTVAITCDHPVSRIQYLPLCAGLAAKEGLGEWNALKAITIDAAEICRVDDRVGSLKEGKDVDIVIYDGSPLEIKGNALITIINGKIVWERDAQY